MTSDPPVVSFDLDGVLIRNPFELGVEPFVRDHIHRGSSLQERDAAEAYATIDEAIAAARNRRMAEGSFVAAFDWDAIYHEASVSFEGPAVPDVAGLVRRFCREPGMIDLLPRAREGLQRLKDQDIRMVVITNGYYVYQWPVLEALGISEFFDSVIAPDHAGCTKPSARIFQDIPGLYAHVGDTLVHDVLGANLAGVRSIWLDPNAPESLTEAPPPRELLEPYVQRAFEADLYRSYHPEATLAACMPDAVARDPYEASGCILQMLDREPAS